MFSSPGDRPIQSDEIPSPTSRIVDAQTTVKSLLMEIDRIHDWTNKNLEHEIIALLGRISRLLQQHCDDKKPLFDHSALGSRLSFIFQISNLSKSVRLRIDQCLQQIHFLDAKEEPGLPQLNLPKMIRLPHLNAFVRPTRLRSPQTLNGVEISLIQKDINPNFLMYCRDGISQGIMELTLFVKKSFVDHVKLVFLYNPTTTAKIGGSFDLTDGSLQKEGTINGPPGTNKKCNTIHQKATIRVNMERREASLFIDDEEQRGKISFEREPMTLGILMESKLRKADLDILQVKFLPADGCGERGIDLKEKEEQMTKAVIEHTTQIKTLQKKIETLEREKKEEMKKTKQAEERADRFEHLRDEIEFDFSLLGSEKSLIEEENTLLEAEKRRLEEENKRLEQELVGLPIWKGTTSLGTGEFHTRSPTLLTQTTLLETDEWRSVFSFDVGSKVWELKIRISSERSTSICLGFLKSPLPRDPSLQTPGSNSKWVGGHFVLCDGSVWTKGKVQSEPGTNKTLTKAGQTAAIQVDLQKKEARLFVDDEIQPGVIRGIPSKLCLTISTGFAETDTSVEVMWMKKFDPIAPK